MSCITNTRRLNIYKRKYSATEWVNVACIRDGRIRKIAAPQPSTAPSGPHRPLSPAPPPPQPGTASSPPLHSTTQYSHNNTHLAMIAELCITLHTLKKRTGCAPCRDDRVTTVRRRAPPTIRLVRQYFTYHELWNEKVEELGINLGCFPINVDLF